MSRRNLRTIAVVTGTRAEYGLLKSTLKAIQRHTRLELKLIVTGIHLLRKFGHTVDQIAADGFPIAARVRMQSGDDSATDQARGLSRGVEGIATYLATSSSDVVVVVGDRIEAMAGAMASVTTGVPVAHIHGGDVAPGDFDDSMRHAITKLAKLHFAATREAARRIIRLGERPDRVHVVGAPGIDDVVELIRLRKSAGKREKRRGPKGGADSPPTAPFAVVLYHAHGRPAEQERRTMANALRAVHANGLKAWVIPPNTDRGHSGVHQAISAVLTREFAPAVRVAKSMDRDAFLRKLMDSRVLVGNSSCGIIEAPMLGTPSVNVGLRQTGRQRAGDCVIDCGESYKAIVGAIKQAMQMKPRPRLSSCYGQGNAGHRIAAILASTPTAALNTSKLITF